MHRQICRGEKIMTSLQSCFFLLVFESQLQWRSTGEWSGYIVPKSTGAHAYQGVSAKEEEAQIGSKGDMITCVRANPMELQNMTCAMIIARTSIEITASRIQFDRSRYAAPCRPAASMPKKSEPHHFHCKRHTIFIRFFISSNL